VLGGLRTEVSCACSHLEGRSFILWLLLVDVKQFLCESTSAPLMRIPTTSTTPVLMFYFPCMLSVANSENIERTCLSIFSALSDVVCQCHQRQPTGISSVLKYSIW
jgi:hypothetical protein